MKILILILHFSPNLMTEDKKRNENTNFNPPSAHTLFSSFLDSYHFCEGRIRIKVKHEQYDKFSQ